MKDEKQNVFYEGHNKYEIYTDLALEARERFENNVEIPGVVLEKKNISDLDMAITKMCIKDELGAKAMGKPQGNYITVESRLLMDEEKAWGKDSDISKVLSREIENMYKSIDSDVKVLIVGLGNNKATPDALGPLVAEGILIRENVVCITPGVFAQTGMETYKIIKGIVREEKPDVVIAVDALAARNTSRVATTVQITDTGIIPGSGIGNHRMGLNKDTLGVPVIAVGVPTVVNSVTIVHDTMEQLLSFLGSYKELEDMTNGFAMFNREEKYMFIDEIMSKGMGKMYVTPKDIDDIVSRLGNILADAINMATT